MTIWKDITKIIIFKYLDDNKLKKYGFERYLI